MTVSAYRLRMTETEFQDSIIVAAKQLGWTVRHIRNARKQNVVGLPDLILIRPPRIIFWEVKDLRRKATVEQQITLNLLDQCPGVESALVRPPDYDWITEQLK